MFKTIGLFGKFNDKSVGNTLQALASHLESRGMIVKIGTTTAEEITRDLPPESIITELCGEIDLAVVVGGDGTMLHVAREMAEANIPMTGINLGHLGFLTDISQDDMLQELDAILDGEFNSERRLMLQVEVLRGQDSIYQQIALNDVVIGKHRFEKLISWRATIGEQLVMASRSDGVILSTPTGSTAYALSAGGPIIYPGIDVLNMVPVSAHTLTNRPIILPGDATVEFTIHNKTPNAAHVSSDGLIGCNLKGDEVVKISRANQSVEILHPKSYRYFSVLRNKLRWGE
jgi:NAD+ kinase